MCEGFYSYSRMAVVFSILLSGSHFFSDVVRWRYKKHTHIGRYMCLRSEETKQRSSNTVGVSWMETSPPTIITPHPAPQDWYDCFWKTKKHLWCGFFNGCSRCTLCCVCISDGRGAFCPTDTSEKAKQNLPK